VCSSDLVNNDFNGATQEGVGYYQCTIRNGERCSVAKAYLAPARSNPNLTVVCHANVSKILIHNGVATGIEYVINGKTHTASAKREVLLCAGAIHSPQILMLSGIGDRAQLEQFNIPVHVDLPGVGENLQEHVDACVLVSSKKRDGFTLRPTSLAKLVPHIFNYMRKRKGKLASTITEAGAFLKSSPELVRPDIQMHMVPLLFDDCGRDLKLLWNHGYSLHVCVLRPESKGSVRLKSADWRDAPLIDFNFFSDPEGKDKKVLLDGLRVARNILAAPAFSSYDGGELHPGSTVMSDDELFAKAKERLGLVYHPVGTCKMGQDALAVVDSELKVHGIAQLRVVDASIMPRLVSGNTNAPTIAIAEKAADLILQSSL
jgi:choline dehydrogenase-like flavoprotein